MVTGDRSYDTGKYFLSIRDDAEEVVQTTCGEWDQMVALGKSIRPFVEKVTIIHVGEYCFTYRDMNAEGVIGGHYH
jgi:hypothetical protein